MTPRSGGAKLAFPGQDGEPSDRFDSILRVNGTPRRRDNRVMYAMLREPIAVSIDLGSANTAAFYAILELLRRRKPHASG